MYSDPMLLVMKKYLTLSIILILFACKENMTVDGPQKITIDCDNIISNKDFSEFMEDSVKLIFLESGENKMIGDITSVRILGDTIYILDKISQSIFRYNQNGEYISKLAARGKANNEYIELFSNCFYVKDMNLYVIDKFGGKILIYDKDNHFIKSVPLKFENGDRLICEYIVPNNDYYSLINKSGRLSDFHFFEIDNTGKICNQQLPVPDFKKSKAWRYGSAHDLISFCNDDAYVSFFGVDTIYSIKHGQITPIYNLDFGKYKISKEQLSGGDNLHKTKGDNTFGIDKFTFAGKYIILHFIVKGGAHVAICSKEGKVLRMSKGDLQQGAANTYLSLNGPIITDNYSVYESKPADGNWSDYYREKLRQYRNGNDYIDYFNQELAKYDFASGNPILLIQKWKE